MPDDTGLRAQMVLPTGIVLQHLAAATTMDPSSVLQSGLRLGVDSTPKDENGALAPALGGSQERMVDFAYAGDWTKDARTVDWYRLARGFPYPRSGRLVKSHPQFKGLTLYPPVNTAISGSFATTVTPVQITYPSKPK